MKALGAAPIEIDRFLTEADSEQQFSYDEFVDRVTERATVEESGAAFSAKAVVPLVCSVASRNEVQDIRSQLPDEFSALFELADAEAARCSSSSSSTWTGRSAD